MVLQQRNVLFQDVGVICGIWIFHRGVDITIDRGQWRLLRGEWLIAGTA
jgi:hypothetical protein